jgi:hypothetical protein
MQIDEHAVCMSAGMVSGVTIFTGTPAIMSFATFTGYTLRICSPPFCCQPEACARSFARLYGGSVSGIGLAVDACASGLMVSGSRLGSLFLKTTAKPDTG